MSILELRAARAWSLQQTANAFLVTAATIASWMKRLDEQGPDALVQIREPVNKFPDFVRYAVQRLKTLCPGLGKVKIAQILCRAGLHLGATTVGRMLKETPHPLPRSASETTGRVVTAKKPNHVWHIDLTVVPIVGGFWTPRLPFALPQCWPFCWWLAVIIDHYSRRAMGVAVFPRRPNSLAVRTFIGKTAARIHSTPKYLICDKDSIFWCAAFKRWCKRKAIRPRYGAIGKHGSIAVVERFIRTMKDEVTRRILVPQRRAAFRKELASYLAWYNEHRPHTTLHGKTPNEAYFSLRPANRRPRIEPRNRWPRSAPCAAPRTLIAGQPGDRFELEVGFHDGRRYLPIVSLRRAA
jgi:putative transposase